MHCLGWQYNDPCLTLIHFACLPMRDYILSYSHDSFHGKPSRESRLIFLCSEVPPQKWCPRSFGQHYMAHAFLPSPQKIQHFQFLAVTPPGFPLVISGIPLPWAMHASLPICWCKLSTKVLPSCAHWSNKKKAEGLAPQLGVANVTVYQYQASIIVTSYIMPFLIPSTTNHPWISSWWFVQTDLLSGDFTLFTTIDVQIICFFPTNSRSMNLLLKNLLPKAEKRQCGGGSFECVSTKFETITWKLVVGRWSFPFGFRPFFLGIC